MEWRTLKFDRVEFAGSLGDLGTLIPLSVALIAINRLNPTSVFLLIGLFYVAAGLYFRLPIPVQPLKVIAAVAIAAALDSSLIAASGLLMGAILLFLAITGLIDWLARFFTKPIVRGIQLGLGLILIMKGIDFILDEKLLLYGVAKSIELFGFELGLNRVVGIAGILIVLFLLNSKRIPAAIAVILFGLAISLPHTSVDLSLGYMPLNIYLPSSPDLWNALILLVIPQIPLTLGNAIIATSDAAKSMFGEKAKRCTNRSLALSMSFANFTAGSISAMPMCHGAGGLAAHYRFGARSGGSNLMIGAIFIAIAMLFGKVAVSVLSLIPVSILGVLLFFAGLELAMLIKDVEKREDIFITFAIAGIGLATMNMGYAFIAGMVMKWVMDKAKIEI